MKRFVLLCLMLTGCEDRPRTAGDVAETLSLDECHGQLQKTQNQVELALAQRDELGKMVGECAQFERSCFRQLQQCRADKPKDLGQGE
jgi:hypothetical protein